MLGPLYPAQDCAWRRSDKQKLLSVYNSSILLLKNILLKLRLQLRHFLLSNCTDIIVENSTMFVSENVAMRTNFW